MGEYLRYLVGDIRVICNIVDGQLTVLVVEIGNRREVSILMKFSNTSHQSVYSKISGTYSICRTNGIDLQALSLQTQYV
jgi:hypothetical protein